MPWQIPVSNTHVIYFLSNLYTQGKRYATIMTYLSAISFINKAYRYPDPASSFLVSKFMTGVCNSSSASPKLLPISRDILITLILNVPFTVATDYDKKLLSAMYSLMYYACLWVGEIAKSSHCHNTIKRDQVHLDTSKNEIMVHFSRYKHSRGKTPTLILQANTDPSCPVSALTNYLQLRGVFPGPLFLFYDGTIVTRDWFVCCLKMNLLLAGHDASMYNTHSFRIGRWHLSQMTCPFWRGIIKASICRLKMFQ